MSVYHFLHPSQVIYGQLFIKCMFGIFFPPQIHPLQIRCLISHSPGKKNITHFKCQKKKSPEKKHSKDFYLAGLQIISIFFLLHDTFHFTWNQIIYIDKSSVPKLERVKIDIDAIVWFGNRLCNRRASVLWLMNNRHTKSFCYFCTWTFLRNGMNA